jgi:hypothetical protein
MARQNDAKFGETSGLGIDRDRAGVLFHDDVTADREAATK